MAKVTHRSRSKNIALFIPEPSQQPGKSLVTGRAVAHDGKRENSKLPIPV